MMDNRPLFSIIIVTLNAEKEIAETLKSIENQSVNDYEVIIKDGGSCDGTLDKIPTDEKYRVVKRQDKSVYDGMNQAIEYARGNFIIFLNAGDGFYNSDVLDCTTKFILKNRYQDEACVIYGDYNRKHEYIQNQPVVLKPFYLYRRPLCHQSIFYNRKLFEIYGKYDLHYKISADHDFNMKLWTSKVPFYHTGVVICTYEGNGISESTVGWKKALEERNQIRVKYYSFADRLKYNTIITLSFSQIRAWLDSNKSPRAINKVYVSLRNRLFK